MKACATCKTKVYGTDIHCDRCREARGRMALEERETAAMLERAKATQTEDIEKRVLVDLATPDLVMDTLVSKMFGVLDGVLSGKIDAQKSQEACRVANTINASMRNKGMFAAMGQGVFARR